MIPQSNQLHWQRSFPIVYICWGSWGPSIPADVWNEFYILKKPFWIIPLSRSLVWKASHYPAHRASLYFKVSCEGSCVSNWVRNGWSSRLIGCPQSQIISTSQLINPGSATISTGPPETTLPGNRPSASPHLQPKLQQAHANIWSIFSIP